MNESLSNNFQVALAKLNPAQRLAVDTIDGPVMVVAGPGTGKTQVLSLRIANILMQTDTAADGILCLTFTNSGVIAMRDRLRTFIGSMAGQVRVSTFHGFGNEMIQQYYSFLGFEVRPELMDDNAVIGLCDQILHERSWRYLRPRANPAQYFGDIKSLISLLKRENISPTDFEVQILSEKESIAADPDNISSRGPTKGELKAEVKKTLEGLDRTLEIVEFYRRYDEIKNEKCLIDYDDVLSLLLQLVVESDDIAAEIRERFLYVLVDEHQDSSGVQNEFLRAVWAPVEQPNIFVVGDDRQLIYGFGGASMSYFESFQHTFAGTRMITLNDNYRSTQRIVDAAGMLLRSELVTADITGHRAADRELQLVAAEYPRDELLAAAIDIRERIADGTAPEECAILVPKNAHVRSAMRVLTDMGIPVAMGDSLRLFELPDTTSLLRVLTIVAHPMNGEAIAASLLDPISGIPPIDAHRWISSHTMRSLTLDTLLDVAPTVGLFDAGNSVSVWGHRLLGWVNALASSDPYTALQIIGKELLLDTATDTVQLSRRVEIIRTLLHHAMIVIERTRVATLVDIMEYIDRLQEYGHDIPLAAFAKNTGVRVMTMHASKGLEFEYVWIAHANQKTLMGGRPNPFMLPESIKLRIEEKDEAVVKRQLYVAITRAKEYCTISYALQSATGSRMEVANMVADIAGAFQSVDALATENRIRSHDTSSYVTQAPAPSPDRSLSSLTSLVSEQFTKTKVSVTLLNNFFECHWKWYFRNLLQLPEPIGDAMRFGSAVHESIEDVLKTSDLLTNDSIREIVEKHIEIQSRGNPTFVVSHLTDAIETVTRWVVNRLPSISHDRDSERAYSFHPESLPQILVTGKIDLVETLSPGHVRVTDFKTGSEKTANEIEKDTTDGRLSNYLRQLAMYSYLINNATRGREAVAESVLEFLEAKHDKHARYATVITADHIQRLTDDITEYYESVASGQWVTRACNYKPFGSETECPYCRRGSELFSN